MLPSCVYPCQQFSAAYGMHMSCVDLCSGLGNPRSGLHPVQARLAKAHGSQCGFCTPGFVMSMYSLLRSKTEAPTETEIEDNLTGNLWCVPCPVSIVNRCALGYVLHDVLAYSCMYSSSFALPAVPSMKRCYVLVPESVLWPRLYATHKHPPSCIDHGIVEYVALYCKCCMQCGAAVVAQATAPSWMHSRCLPRQIPQHTLKNP